MEKAAIVVSTRLLIRAEKTERHLSTSIGATSCRRRILLPVPYTRFLWTDSRTGRSSPLPRPFAHGATLFHERTENSLFGSKNERGRTSRRTFSQILFHRDSVPLVLPSFFLPFFPPFLSPSLPYSSILFILFIFPSFSR